MDETKATDRAFLSLAWVAIGAILYIWIKIFGG